jgi:hypothetical protein
LSAEVFELVKEASRCGSSLGDLVCLTFTGSSESNSPSHQTLSEGKKKNCNCSLTQLSNRKGKGTRRLYFILHERNNIDERGPSQRDKYVQLTEEHSGTS